MEVKFLHNSYPTVILNYMKKMGSFGSNITIEDGVKIVGKCSFGLGVVITGNSVIENSTIGEGTKIENSTIKDSIIGNNCVIGPFSHIRPNCKIDDNVKIGSFAEVKNSNVGKGTKIPHLSYVGDANIGENVNVGCGVVFANYDGVTKRRSIIGNDVFIGCNVNIVAPVKIADKTYICAGTTVTKDTNVGDFVIGRVRQENKKR